MKVIHIHLILYTEVQVHLHGKALVTARNSTAEGLLPLMVSQHVALQVEAASELFLTTFFGARKQSLFPGVNAKLMQAQEPEVAEQLVAPSTQNLV